jgi:hypothetical protein
MRNRLLVGVGCLIVGTFGAVFVSSQEAPERSTITLEKAVHFLSPDGADAVLTPGTYTAKPEGEKAIQVIARDGGATTTIQAEAGTHEQQLSAPESVAVASDEDVVHIVLLMPGGTTLDAIDTFSGVSTRAPSSMLPPPRQMPRRDLRLTTMA